VSTEASADDRLKRAAAALTREGREKSLQVASAVAGLASVAASLIGAVIAAWSQANVLYAVAATSTIVATSLAGRQAYVAASMRKIMREFSEQGEGAGDTDDQDMLKRIRELRQRAKKLFGWTALTSALLLAFAVVAGVRLADAIRYDDPDRLEEVVVVGAVLVLVALVYIWRFLQTRRRKRHAFRTLCPACHELVSVDAAVCKHCGHRLRLGPGLARCATCDGAVSVNAGVCYQCGAPVSKCTPDR
jgi:hypothetical protein